MEFYLNLPYSISASKSKIYFSGLFLLILLALYTGGLVELGKDKFRRSEQNYADFTHFLYAASLQNLYWQ